MNLNIITYFTCLIINVLIIIKVGHICYSNGKIFISTVLPNNNGLASQINHLLLMGYYLINIGYTIYMTHNWEPLYTIHNIVESIAEKTALILLTLATLHYFNILWINKYIKNFN